MRPLFLLLLLATTANARLGETEQELTKRFSQPVYTQPEQIIAQGKFITIGQRHVFKQNDWTITAIVTEGRCSQIKYSHGGDWTETQFKATLTANSQAATWTDTSSPDEGLRKVLRSWKRADGGTASWALGTLTIANPAYERARKKAEAKAKAEASKIPKI